MKYKNIVFDDVVKDKSGKWSQVCDSCIEKHFKDEVWDDIPIDNTICGVKDCNNEATFYLDFKTERGININNS